MGSSELIYLSAAEFEAQSGGRRGGPRLAGIYVQGSLEGLAGTTVAVVGTRAPSDAGRRLALRLGEGLGRAGACVISGLALGIDAAAHRGALAAGAPTIGVLGGGHARFYPPANRELADEIVAGGGAVLSPFAPEHPALPPQFLQRNAVIAALADAVVVVEAAARSGSLNTAAWAADSGKPVMAFPGDVERPKVAGCLALIRDGALLVRDADDVLAALPAGPPLPGVLAQCAQPYEGKTGLERALLAALREGERDLDALLALTGAGAGPVLAAISDLEIACAIQRRDGRRFAAV